MEDLRVRAAVATAGPWTALRARTWTDALRAMADSSICWLRPDNHDVPEACRDFARPLVTAWIDDGRFADAAELEHLARAVRLGAPPDALVDHLVSRWQVPREVAQGVFGR